MGPHKSNIERVEAEILETKIRNAEQRLATATLPKEIAAAEALLKDLKAQREK